MEELSSNSDIRERIIDAINNFEVDMEALRADVTRHHSRRAARYVVDLVSKARGEIGEEKKLTVDRLMRQLDRFEI